MSAEAPQTPSSRPAPPLRSLCHCRRPPSLAPHPQLRPRSCRAIAGAPWRCVSWRDALWLRPSQARPSQALQHARNAA
eukprot:1185573-Rhodomonas_salina.2